MFVNSEVGKLRKAGMFEPGTYTYLLQFYPPEVSLFFDSFDILKGLVEFHGLVGLLESLDVEIVDLKGAYADTLQAPPISAEELIKQLHANVPQSSTRILEGLLQMDATRYGEEKAVALNANLSLYPDLPMGNIIFARDQSNVVYRTCVLGNMRYKARQPEVDVIHAALLQLGYRNFLQVNGGTFEGGDAMIINGNIQIGNGMRTSFKAIQQIAKYFADKPYFVGKTTYAVVIPTTGDFKRDMEIMHYDTFFMPWTGGNQVNYAIGCREILDGCQIIDLRDGVETPFLEHFIKNGYDILNIPIQEQKNYAANVRTIGQAVGVVPSEYNKTTSKMLSEKGKIHSANLSHLTNAVGATHCMVLPLEQYN